MSWQIKATDDSGWILSSGRVHWSISLIIVLPLKKLCLWTILVDETGWLNTSEQIGKYGLAWMNLAVISVQLISGEAIWDRTGSHWSGVGRVVSEAVRMVPFS